MTSKKPKSVTKSVPVTKPVTAIRPTTPQGWLNLLCEEGDIKNTPLGTKMRDKITKFEGIATAKVVYLNGCVQFALKSEKLDKEGKPMEAPTIDCQQLEIVDNGINPLSVKQNQKPTGGDMPDALSLMDY